MGDDDVSEALKEKLEELNSAFDAQQQRQSSLTFDVEQVATSVVGLLQELPPNSRSLAFCSALLFAERNSLLTFLDAASGDSCKSDKDLIRARVCVYGGVDLWLEKLSGRHLAEHADALLQRLFAAFVIELGDNKRHAVKPLKQLFLRGEVAFKWEKLSLETLTKTLFDLVTKGSRARNTATLRGKPKGQAMAILGLLLRRYAPRIGGNAFDYGEPFRRKLLAYCLHVLQKESEKVKSGKRPELYLMSGALECIRHALPQMEPSKEDIAAVFGLVSRFVVVPEAGLPNYFVPEEALNILRDHAELFRGHLLLEHVNFYAKVEKCVVLKQSRVRKASVPAVKAVLEQISQAVGEDQERPLKERKSILLLFIQKFHAYISRFEEGNGDLANALVEIAVHAFGCFAKSIRVLQGTESLKQVLLKLFEISEHFDRDEARQAASGEVISMANAALFGGSAVTVADTDGGGSTSRTEVDDQAEVRSESIVRNSAFLKAFARIVAELPPEMILSNNDEALLDVVAKGILKLAGNYYKCQYRDQYYITEATSLVLITLNDKAQELCSNVLQKVTQPILVLSMSTLPEGTRSAGIYDPDTGLPDLRLLFEYERYWSKLFACAAGTQVFDHWMRAVLEVIKTANLTVVLSLEARGQNDSGEEGESNLYLEQTLGNIENLQPESPADFKYFINLVDLCRRVLPPKKRSFNRELFFKWRHMWVTECIKTSNKFTYVSGLYKLLQIGFTMINDKGMTAIDEWEYLDSFLKLAMVRSRQYKDELLCAILACVLHVPTFLVTPRLKLLMPCLLTALGIGLSFPDMGLCALETVERWILFLDSDMLDHYMPEILPALGRFLNAPKEDQGTGETGKGVALKGRVAKLEGKVLAILGRIGGRSQQVMPPLKKLLEDSVVWDAKQRVKVQIVFDKLQLDVCLDEALPRLVELATATTNRKVKVAACEVLHGVTIFMIGRTATQPQPVFEFGRIYRKIFPCLFNLAIDVETVTRQLFSPLLHQIATWFARNAEHENAEMEALLDTALDNLGHHSNGALRDLAANILAKFVKFAIKSGSETAAVNIKVLLRRLYVLMKHPDPHKRLGSCLAFDKFYTDFRENSALVDEFVLELLRNAFLSLKIAHRDPKELPTVSTASGFLAHLFRIVSKYASLLSVYNSRRRGFKDLYHLLRWLFRMLPSRETAFRKQCADALLIFCSSIPSLRDKVEPPTHPARAFLLARLQGKSPGVAVDSDDDAQLDGDGGVEAIVKGLESQLVLLQQGGRIANKTLWMESLGGCMDAYHMLLSFHLLMPSELEDVEGEGGMQVFTAMHTVLSGLESFSLASEEAMAGAMGSEMSVPYDVMVSTITSAMRLVTECLEHPSLVSMMKKAALVVATAEAAVLLLLEPETLGFTSKADPRDDPALVAAMHGLLQVMKEKGEMPEKAINTLKRRQEGLPEKSMFETKTHAGVSLRQAMLRGHTLLFQTFPLPAEKAQAVGAAFGKKLLQLDDSPPPQLLDLASGLLQLAFILGWPCCGKVSQGVSLMGMILEEEGGRKVFRQFEEMILAYLLEKEHWAEAVAELLQQGVSDKSFRFYLLVKAVTTFVAAKDTIRDIYSKISSDTTFLNSLLPPLSDFVKRQDKLVVEEYALHAWHLKLYTLFAALSTLSLSSSTAQLDDLLYTLLDLVLTEKTAIATKADALGAIGNLLPGTVGGQRRGQRLFQEEAVEGAFVSRVLGLVRRRIVVNHFPLEPSIKVTGKRADDFAELLKGLLTAAETSGAPDLFVLFDKVLHEGDKHKHAVDISASLQRMAQRAEVKKREGQEVSPASCLAWAVVAKVVAQSGARQKQTIKQALVAWVLLPLLRRMEVDGWTEFLLHKSAQLGRARTADKLLALLKDDKQDFLSRDCACQVACKLFECLCLDDVKQVNAAYQQDEKSNAFTLALVKFFKVQFKQVKPRKVALPADVEGGKEEKGLVSENGSSFLLGRMSDKQRLYSSMLQGYCSIICRTQTKPKFFYGLFTWLLQDTDATRWHVLIPMVQGIASEFQFTVETSFSRQQLSSTKLLLPPPDAHMQRTFAALTSLATPSQGILTAATASPAVEVEDNEQEGDGKVEVECGADEEEELDLDPFNSLPTMKSMLGVLDVMRQGGLLGLDVSLEEAIQSQAAALPEWAEVLLDGLKGSGKSRETLHVRLFVCRLIMNRPTLFAAFAKRLVEPLVELAVFMEEPYGDSRGFHYLFRDLYLLLGRWHRLNPSCVTPKKTEKTVALLGGWLQHLTRVCASERSYVLRMNLQMINRLLAMWKPLGLSLPLHHLVSLVNKRAEERGKKAEVQANMSRVVGLNLLGAAAQNEAFDGLDEVTLAGLTGNLVHKRKGVRLLCADVLATMLLALSKAKSELKEKLEEKIQAALEAAFDHQTMQGKGRVWVEVMHAFMAPAIEAKLDVSKVVSRLMSTRILSLLSQLQGGPFEMAFRIAEYACPPADVAAKAVSVASTIFHDATDCSSFLSLQGIVEKIFAADDDLSVASSAVLLAAAKHRKASCRVALVSALTHLYLEDKVELVQKEEIRLVLLGALSDSSPEVSSVAMEFWREAIAGAERPLFATLTTALTDLKPFSSSRAIDPNYWTCATSVMLLSRARAAPEYHNDEVKLFDRPLSECDFNPVTLDASWQSSLAPSQPVAGSQPLFSQSLSGTATLASQPQAFGTQTTGFFSQRFAHPGMVRATQDFQRFAPTQMLAGPSEEFLGTQADAALARPKKKRRVARRGPSASQASSSQVLFKVEDGGSDVEEMPPPGAVKGKKAVSVLPRHLDRSFGRVAAGQGTGQSQVQSGLNRFQIQNLRKRKATQAQEKREEQKRARQVVIYRKYRKGEIPDIQITLKDLVEPVLALCGLDAPFSTAILTALVRALNRRLDKPSRQLLGRYYQSLLEGSCTHPSFIACVQRLIHDTLSCGADLDLSTTAVAKAGLASHNHASSILLLETLGKVERSRETLLQLYKMYEQLDEEDVMLGIMQTLSQEALPALRLQVAGDFAAAAKAFDKLGQDSALGPVWEQARVHNLFMAGRWQRILKEAGDRTEEAWQNAVQQEDPLFWMQLWSEPVRHIYLRAFLVAATRLPDHNAAFLSLLQHSLDRSSEMDSPDIPGPEFRAQWCSSKAPVELVLSHLLNKVPAFALAEGGVDAFKAQFLRTWAALPALAVSSRMRLLTPLQRMVDCSDFLRCRSDMLHSGWEEAKVLPRLQKLVEQWQVSLPSPTLNTSDEWEECIFIRNKLLLILREEVGAREDEKLLREVKEKVQAFAVLAYRAAAGAAASQGAFSLASKYVKYLEHLGDESHALEAVRIKRIQALATVSTSRAKKLLRHLIEHMESTQLAPEVGKMSSPSALVRAQLVGSVHADMLDRFIRSGKDAKDVEEERQRCLETAFEYLSQAAKGYLDAKTALYEPQPIAEACLVFAQFCNKMEHAEWAKNRLGSAELVQLAIKNYLTAASFGSVEAIDTFPKVLELLAKHSEVEAVKGCFNYTIQERCSPWIFLRWIPQILSLFADLKGNLVVDLLEAMAKEYPHVLHSPFRVSMEALKARYSSESLPGEISAVAARVSHLLENPLMDAFVEALQGLNHPELRLQDALKLMRRISETKLKDPEKEAKARELFKARFVEDLGCTHKAHVGEQIGSYNLQYTRRYIQRWMKKHDLATADKFSMSKWRKASKDLKVQPCGDLQEMATEKFSTWLSDFSDSDVAGTSHSLLVPGEYEKLQRPGRLVKPTEQNKVAISSFGQQLKVMASLRKPKRLVIRGSDEEDYAFLVKGGEDLRLDQRIEQLFAVMNHIFQQSSNCAGRHLEVKEYAVIPLSLDTGILGWLNDTTPVQAIIEEQYNSHTQLQEYEKRSPKSRRRLTLAEISTAKHWRTWFASGFKSKYKSMYDKLEVEQDVSQFEKLAETMPSDLLQRHIMAITSSPESFLAVRSQTARSIGCLSMCSYVLGIGDRHLANFLFDEKDGTVIPIDFGYSFGIGVTMLPVPETTPFRFTNVFSSLLDPLGHDGLYKNTMLHVLNSLHQQPDLLMNTMEVFLKEPLIDWATDVESSTDGQESSADWLSRNRIQCAKFKLQSVDPVKVMCTEIMQRTKMKHLAKHPAAPKPKSVLKVMGQLYETDTDADLLHMDPEEIEASCIGVAQQVDRLIDMATCPSLLLRQFEGFASWV